MTSLIQKMTPHVNKLIELVKKDGVTFSPIDGDNDNVVFTKKNKVLKIAHIMFYRYSGICVVQKGEDIVELKDSDFYLVYIKALIDHNLK